MKLVRGTVFYMFFVLMCPMSSASLVRNRGIDTDTLRSVSKQEVMANMTSSAAVASFMNMRPKAELVNLLESNFGMELADMAGQGFVSADHAQRVQVTSSGNADPSGDAETKPANYTGVEKARDMLNSMIAEAQRKLDIETVTGIEFEERQLGLLSEVRGHIAKANADAAAARGVVLDAEAKILRAEKKLPLLNEELGDHERNCKKELASLEAQLAIVKEDLGVMDIILNMTQCDEGKKSTQGNAGEVLKFIACNRCKSGARVLAISHPGISEELKKLRSSQVRNMVQQSLAKFFDEEAAEDVDEHASKLGVRTRISSMPRPATALSSKVQGKLAPLTGNLAHPKVGSLDQKRVHIGLLQNLVGVFAFNDSGNIGNLTVFPPNVLNTTDVPKQTERHDCVQTDKCSIANSPNCPRIQDRFMQIASEMEDLRDDLIEKLDMRNVFCEETSVMYKDQINELEELHNSELARHAEGTKEQVDSERASHQYDASHHEMEKDYYKKMKANCATKNQLTSEICALEKIRGELMRMKGISAAVQDCEVGKWVHEPCTVTCGGGKQRSTRLVTVQPRFGSPCPALEMEQDCGSAPCPIDCVLSDWSGWSECSAECGGGLMTRQRQIKVEQQHDGEPCGDTMQSVTCNLEACNADCTLADWTDWGSCSKACDGGVLKRYKKVTKPAKGSGVCAPAMSKQRMQYQPCNRFDCVRLASDPKGLIECKSKIDVIFLMDASSSLRRSGWDASKKTVLNLIKKMKGTNGTVNMAFLLFSGPMGRDNFNSCLTGSATDLRRACGMQWVSRFTNDTDRIYKQVKKLKWARGSTLTSMALTMAREEIKYGRQDANTKVIVITDGRPLSPKRTTNEAKQLQAQAQVVWVLAGPKAPKASTVRRSHWASRPMVNNVVTVKELNTLNHPKVRNRIIANVCPLVG